jgi:cytochrome c oxidase subunit 2
MSSNPWFPMPALASLEGREIDTLMYFVHLLMLVLFVGWAIFFVVTLAKFRQTKNPKVHYERSSSSVSATIELGVAALEVLLLFGFSIPFWATHMGSLPQGRDILEIRVVAQQFGWNIHYSGLDGKFGRASNQFLDLNPLGLDPHDPIGKDDITLMNQLYLPVGKTVLIHLTSKDVVHSFAIPEMRIKQDTIPGLSTNVWFTPIKTGQYEIVCSQLCGLAHYQMRGFVTVETQNEFNQWFQQQKH